MQAESVDMRDKAHDATVQTRKFLRRVASQGYAYPVTATVSGMLIGFLLGAALFRTRSRH